MFLQILVLIVVLVIKAVVEKANSLMILILLFVFVFELCFQSSYLAFIVVVSVDYKAGHYR